MALTSQLYWATNSLNVSGFSFNIFSMRFLKFLTVLGFNNPILCTMFHILKVDAEESSFYIENNVKVSSGHLK